MFLGLFAAIAYAVGGEGLRELFINQRTGEGTARYFFVAKGMDDGIYAISQKDGYRITRLQPDGSRDYERELKTGLPAEFELDNLHVTESGLMLISVYEQAVDGLSHGVYASSDEGRSFATLLSTRCTGNSYWEQRDNVFLSSFSEYDGQVMFFRKKGITWEQFTLTVPRADSEERRVVLKSEGIFQLRAEIVAGISDRDGTIYAGGAEGSFYTITGQGDRIREEEGTERLYTRFMQKGDGFSYINGRTGNLVNLTFAPKTETALLRTTDLPCASKDVTHLTVGADGTVILLEGFGKLRIGSPYREILVGSDSEEEVVEHINFSGNGQLYDESSSSMIKLVGIGIAMLILAYSFYYLVTDVRKLYFPMALRGLLSLGLLAFITVTFALQYIIEPQYIEDSRASIQTSLYSYARAPGIFDETNRSGRLADSGAQTGFQRVTLYRMETSDYVGESPTVRASTDRTYGKGFLANAPGALGALTENMSGNYAAVVAGDTVLYVAYVRESGGDLLVATADATDYEATMRASYDRLSLMIYGLSFVVVLFAAVILEMSAGRARQITRGVDAIGEGLYDAEVTLYSGDELSTLADSFNSLADTLKKQYIGDERRSMSYLQFIPQQVVSLMGVGSIEEVSRATSASSDLAMMVVWFSFPDEVYQSDPQTLFESINAVIERTSSVVTKNGGTVYNFAYDGYDAVFPEGSDSAVSTAVEIRQGIMALNRERKALGLPQATLRVAIAKGNVMMGVVGDDSRMSPTAVSSCLSTARMLVQLSQTLDVNILCTMEVAEETEGYFVRYIGKRLDGGTPIRVYEITDGDEQEVRVGKEKTRRTFSDGVYLVYGREFTAAKRQFMDIAHICADDGVSRYYLYLSDKMETDGTGEVYLG